MFDKEQFIADLRTSLAERSRKAMAEIVARAVADPASIVRQLGEPAKPGVAVLHKSPELTVLTLAWAPRQITLPHDHRMGAVIGMYGGREDNMFWRKVLGKQTFQIEPAGGEALGTGNVTILGRDIVHSVVNPIDKISVAIHVYDGDFFEVQRSMWDAERLVEQPYDINAVAKGMPRPARVS
jgi:predicted metal-dependent enzyme (double-stranded beta helix superfamily)